MPVSHDDRRRRCAASAVALILLLVLPLSSCSSGEPDASFSDLALVQRLKPRAAAGYAGKGSPCLGDGGRRLPAGLQYVERSRSSREAVVTCTGRSFYATVTLPPNARLEISLAFAGQSPDPQEEVPLEAPATAQATVELVAAGERKTLFATRLAATDDWESHRIDLGVLVPAAARAPATVDLVLESTGPRPIAWSESST